MSLFEKTTSVAAVAAVVLAASVLCPTAAQASPGDDPTTTATLPVISEKTVREAVTEARAAGALTRTVVGPDGARTFTISTGTASLDLTDPGPAARLGAGSDKNGLYVDFNQFDQGAIVGGGAAAASYGLCLLGPAVCAVATVAVTLASTAITTHGVRCGTHVMRVHLSGRPGPKCL